MKLRVEVNGNNLSLFEDMQLQLDMESPVYFGDRQGDAIPNIKAYSFLIPNSSANRIALDRPELLDNPNDLIKVDDCRIYFESNLILVGIGKVTNAPKSAAYTFQFLGGLAGNLSTFKDQFITELDYDGDRSLGADEAAVLAHAKLTAQDFSSYDYTFPMIKIAETAGSEYEYINHYYNDAYFKMETIATVDTYSTLVPCPKLHYVLDHIFSSVGYTLAGVFDDHPHKDELLSLIIFNIQSLDFTTTENPDVTNFTLATELNIKNHLPQVTVDSFIKAVCFTFCWTPFISPQLKIISIKDNKRLLDQKTSIDWSKKVNPEYNKERKNTEIISVLCYNHSSDDDLELPSSLDGVGEVFFVDTLADLPTDLTTNEVGRVYYVNSLNHYYDFIGIRPPDIELFNLRAQVFRCNEDNPVQSIELNTDTLYMINKSVNDLILGQVPFNPGSILLPQFYTKLISRLYEDVKALKDLPLLFYRGLVEDANTDEYPMANNSNYDLDENDTYDLSLLINGEKGIYKTWWEAWLTAVKNMSPVTYNTRVTSNDLEQLDFSKKIRIDKHEYFIRRIRITLTPNEIKPATIDYMKLS